MKVARAYANRLMWNVRFDTSTACELVHCFCLGVPLANAAEITGVSARTVRAVYCALRWPILEGKFAIWHGITLIDPVSHSREWVFDSLMQGGFAACYFNRYCQRNFALGNRRVRICRSCPAREGFDLDSEYLHQAERLIRQMDGARAFYARIGLRERPGQSPGALALLQNMHYRVIANALDASRRRDGTLDFEREGPLTVKTLYGRLVQALLDWPIEV